MIKIKSLGQSGFCFNHKNVTIYIDPYLSNSIEFEFGSNFKRLIPSTLYPNNIIDADYVLITHIHQDHCDLDTLLPIAKNCPNCIFIAPNEVCKLLFNKGVKRKNIKIINKKPILLNKDVKLYPTKAFHPNCDIDIDNKLKYVGFIFDFGIDGKLYHAGDTFLNNYLIKEISKYKPIHTAFIPINEHNYFKEKNGIIGNMSMMEAFGFAEILEVTNFVPIHWDLFKINSVSIEEINSCYKNGNYNFKLLINPNLI